MCGPYVVNQRGDQNENLWAELQHMGNVRQHMGLTDNKWGMKGNTWGGQTTYGDRQPFWLGLTYGEEIVPIC